MTWRRWLIFGAMIGLGALLMLLQGLDDFDLAEFDQTPLRFENDGHSLSGTLILPSDLNNPPVAVIVHGDGPQDRFSSDGYLPLFHVLLDAGIGVFSWDKPGVGESGGDWLAQSMEDRTDEAIAALEAVQARTGVSSGKIGYLGFSQAGWVIPSATTKAEPAFSVLIGPAVNWQAQGAYFTRQRLNAQGTPEAEIAASIAARMARDKVVFAPGYAPTAEDLRGMTFERFAFVARNHTADATQSISDMTGPVLAVWGADDLNVDATTDARIYQDNLPDPSAQRVLIVPNATHGLLRSPIFNYQLTDQWPAYVQAAFVMAGRHAFAPDALDQITEWITAQMD